ncbi:MAG: molecular chaperone TorD family protein [Acidimicrobiales bacterium]
MTAPASAESYPRGELFRALGAVCDSAPGAAAVAPALGLGPLSGAEHTTAFVMNCPPYASVYLGGEGKLGGDGSDRVAGFWRALGLVPPAEPDHLATLFALYGHLAEAEQATGESLTKRALTKMRQVLLWEHLWTWVPNYLLAVDDLGLPPLCAWQSQVRRVLEAEFASGIPIAATALPLAMREAPKPVSVVDDLDDLLDALVAPIRSGVILTRKSLAGAAQVLRVGHRIGERRFALRAMLEQSPARTFDWLAKEAERWAQRQADSDDLSSRWWSTRSLHSARVLSELADAAGRPVKVRSGR